MNVVMLLGAMIIYSLSNVFGKYAAGYDFLSVRYVLFLGLDFFFFALYSVLWQQILKRMQLSAAMSAKPLTILLGVLWGVVLFAEKITPVFIVSVVLVGLGIGVMLSDGKNY